MKLEVSETFTYLLLIKPIICNTPIYSYSFFLITATLSTNNRKNLDFIDDAWYFSVSEFSILITLDAILPFDKHFFIFAFNQKIVDNKSF